MFHPPSREVASALASFFAALRGQARTRALELATPAGIIRLPQYDVGNHRWLILEATDDAAAVASLFRAARPASFDDPGLFEISIAVIGLDPGRPGEVVERGVRVEAFHSSIAGLVGLPAGWQATQLAVVEQALQPVKFERDFRLAALTIRDPRGDTPDSVWMDGQFTWGTAVPRPLVYLQAEAGKGKSTLLAEHVRTHLSHGVGPLPVFIPLRNLQRGMGVSWEAIASTIGIVGASAERLAQAAKSGLVALFLDGLDEVSGRYDPNVVKQVLDVVNADLRSDASLIAVSGRTTEAAQLPTDGCQLVEIHLPGVDSAAFRDYVSVVVDSLVPDWPSLARRLPEPPLESNELPQRTLLEAEKAALAEWIALVFDDFGKERSLFFVQSLSCFARTKQLLGNQPLVISGRVETSPSLYETCVLAASLACVREQDKIESLARNIFSPDKQLEALAWFALLASVDSATRAKMPTPNELVSSCFDVDPTNQNEEFTAVLRQMQKHAVLFASTDGLKAADWRPEFLSDWIRSTLLVRAWLRRDTFAAMAGNPVSDAIVCAQRARIAFGSLFPDICGNDESAVIGLLVPELLRLTGLGSPDACANFWTLFTGLADACRIRVDRRPEKLMELSDLSGLTFDALELGEEFSGDLVVMAGTEFSSCTLSACAFTTCDLSDARFRDCAFANLVVEYCGGPVTFDGCQFVDCKFVDLEGPDHVAWHFLDCDFENCLIEQNRSATSGRLYEPVCIFRRCSSDGTAVDLLKGDWLGIEPVRVTGIIFGADGARRDPAELTLLRVIRPFFPSRSGEDDLQARGYIRSSALGRGKFPAGAPGPTFLTTLLFAEGFTTGGREGHIYAPWSRVGGQTHRDLRNDLITFIRGGAASPAVTRMLVKIRREAGWN